ncbi:MAG: glycosyltransferase [Bacilli bacterium]|nr:glycosyltransferase [Bacilli bacterium]
MSLQKLTSKIATPRVKSILFYTIACLVFLYAFSIPSFGGREKWNYIMYGIMIVLTGAVAIYIALFKELINFKRWQYYLIPLFALFAVIGTLISSHQYRAWLSLVILAASMFVLMQAFSILNDRNLILILISAAIFCFSIYFIYHYRTDIINFTAFKREGFRLGFDFDNPNAISAVCAIGCFCCLYLVLFWNTKWKYLFLIPFLAIGLAGVSTGSRTFIVAIVVMVLSLLFFRFKKHKIMMLTIVIVVIILFFIIINLPFAETIKNRFERFFLTFFSDSSRVDTSAIERMLWFDYGFGMGFKNLLFGLGVDGFSVFSGVGTYAHSNFAEVICDFGVIGLFVFYAPLFIVAYQTIKDKRRCTPFVITLFIYYIVVSLSNVFYYNKFYYLIMALMFYFVFEIKEENVQIADVKEHVKKIVFTCDGMESGGAEKVVATLANELDRQGFSVSIVGVSSFVEESFYKLNDNVSYETLHKNGSKKIGFIRRVFLLNKTLKRLKPDVVISFLPHVIVYTNFAMFNINKPLIVSERNDPNLDPKGSLLRALKYYSFSQADGCVFQTTDARNYFSKSIQKKSLIINNPLQISYEGNLPENRKKTIISVGRLNKQKNYPMLIDAFKIFKENNPNYELKIYGSGPLEEEIRNYIVSSGLEGSVSLMGNSNTWHSDEHDASLFASSSDYEGMPNALAEAIALGIPVVSTNCPIGGPKELIFNGLNGYLCSVGNPIDMANKMEEALSIDISADNVTSFKNQRTADVITNKWLEYIKTVLERKVSQ